MAIPEDTTDPLIARVRARLGRSRAARSLPVPPAIDEPVARRVHADIGLAELFVSGARQAGIAAELVHPDELAARLLADVHRAGVRRVAVIPTATLEKLGVMAALSAGSISVVASSPAVVLTPYAAVAETGSLVFRPAPGSVKHLFVVVEPRHLVADLLDLFQNLSDQPEALATALLTGTQPRMTAYVLH